MPEGGRSALLAALHRWSGAQEARGRRV